VGLTERSPKRIDRGRLLVGFAVAILIWVLYQLGVWQPLEYLCYKGLFYLRGSLPWGDQVVMVEIRNTSEVVLDSSPWPRQRYTELLNQLTGPASPAVIALDVLLTEPDPADDQLAAAIARHGGVVLAQTWDQTGVPLLPPPTLGNAAAGMGHIETQSDADGQVRGIELYIGRTPALALTTARIYAQLQNPELLPDRDSTLWINWLTPLQQVTRYAAADIISGDIPAAAFADKVVVIGTHAVGWEAIATPYDRTDPVSDLFLQATAINNLLQQNALYRPNLLLLPLLLIGGPGLSLLLSQWRFEKQVVTWAGLCAAWLLISLIAFRLGYWLPTATPIVLFALTGGAVALTDQYRTTRLLQQSEERYALAVRGANEGLWDWNLKTDRIYFSPRWKEMLGYLETELDDRPESWFNRIHPDDLESLKEAIDEHLTGVSSHLEHEHRIQHRDGHYRWVLSRGMAVRDRDGKAYRMAGSQTDVTERKQAEEKLRRLALYDNLTELPNRAFFLDELRHAIAHAQRQPLYTFAVLLLDLDRFQVVNTSLGNAIGDQLLVAIAHRLKAFLAPDGIVARLGGDEFAILLVNIENASDAIRLADQIQRLLALPFHLEGHEVFTTVSIGITLSAAHYSQPEHLLRDADTAMYRAKSQGKARCQVFDKTMHTRMVVRLQLENDLRRAITQEQRHSRDGDGTDVEELQLYYQPVVDLRSERVVGFEALVRWQHPEQGFLSPSRFIPMAEETGLIIPLGWWILRQACRQTRRWHQHYPDLVMNVNLASRQFYLPDLPEQVSYILEETNLEPSCLKLEITESTIMENARSVIATLHELRALRIQLAIDDFGTGYSSLSYLRRFPINTLKIDRSFVSRMAIDSDNAEIVRTIVTLAHNLGMDVTAEGVEQPEQASQLNEMACELAQGYLFGKPLSTEDATHYLHENLGGENLMEI
jgi:diguanylate cyclase (GGDEF)-like protein/PAS domain S-box-containing protein